jgi:hypothetical protein
MREIDQDLNALFDDLVAPLAAHTRHKTDSASVVLVRRIIKTLRRRQTVVGLPVGQRGISRGRTAQRATRQLSVFGTGLGLKSTTQNFDWADGKFKKLFPAVTASSSQKTWPTYRSFGFVQLNHSFDAHYPKNPVANTGPGSGILSG